MSKKLAGKIHYFHPPIPLLPTYYSSSGLQHNSNLMNNEDVESEQQQENQQPQKTVDSSTVHDYGFEHLLNDHILGEQASAAFLCGKLQGLLRCNTSKLMQIDHHNNNSTTTATTDSSNDIDTNIVGSNCNDVSRLIQQLFTKAEKGLNNCHSIDEQNKVIKEIQDLIISGIKTDISTPLSSSVDIVNGMINDSYTSASTVNTNDNGNRLSSKRRRLTKKLSTIPTTVNVDDSEKKEQLLPATIRKLLYPTCYSSSPSLSLVHESNDSFSEPDNSRLLASFDPFVIRLASRIINPDYLGNGLLSNVRSDYYHFSANHSCHSDMILWTSPQSQSLSIGRISSLLKTTGARESERFFTLTLPSTNLSSRSFCELDSCFIDESGERISIIGRLLPTSNSKKSVVYMQMKVKDVSDLSSSSIEHIQIIPGSSKHCVTTKTAIASVCMSRSIPGEWCMAGNYLDKKGDRKAAIYLYNCSDSKLPIWSGYVNLGNYTEAIAKENAMCLQSTASSSSSWPKKDPVQLDIESYCQYSTRKLRLFQHHSSHYWLRVGFGSYPGELCLTTTRRILVFDTRAPLSLSSNAYQLLNIAEKSSQFNSTDYITYCSPKWMGDVYILAGGYYSMFLLDKRMPNRTVLHWSHNLTKPLAHLHWTKVESRYQSMYNDIPQFLVSMTSQYASDMSTFGMNFNSASGPQYVGPCLSGMPLTSLVTSFPPSNTFQSSSQNALFKTRLQSSVCGITSYYYPLPTDDGKNQFHTLLLTSYGDLFDYCAYLQDQTTIMIIFISII
ncbi:unnamed protein product [Heterobilharzia americana]|nr:unnamed protein product [Heterobilharzia americana]